MTATTEQAHADRRLAWSIVLGCAMVTLVLLLLLAPVLRRAVNSWADTQWRHAMDQAHARMRRQAEEAPRSGVADRPDAPVAALPSDAHPIGRVSAWVDRDDYPAYAIRAGDEGRVRVMVTVSPAGSPTGCATVASSGHWSLDNATCAVMLNKGRFDRAAPGRTMARHWTSPSIRWVLPRD